MKKLVTYLSVFLCLVFSLPAVAQSEQAKLTSEQLSALHDLKNFINLSVFRDNSSVALTVLTSLKKMGMTTDDLGPEDRDQLFYLSVKESLKRIREGKKSSDKGCLMDASYQLHYIELLSESYMSAAERNEFTQIRQTANQALIDSIEGQDPAAVRKRTKKSGCVFG